SSLSLVSPRPPTPTLFPYTTLFRSVDVPVGELGGEPHVLTTPADRERQLLVRDHHLDALTILVEHHLGDFRRRERVHHEGRGVQDRKSTRLNSSHDQISYAVFCLKK